MAEKKDNSKAAVSNAPAGRKLIYGLTAAVITAALIATALEAVLFAAGLFPPSPYRRSGIDGLVFEMKPGAILKYSDHTVKLNSEGFRDDEFKIEKKPGVTRVVCLGDSMTQAVALPADAVYTNLLENSFEQRGAAFEFFNMAIGGYNTAQELIVYDRKAEKYDPDLILVQFILNDLTYSYPVYTRDDLPGRIKIFLGGHFRTYRLLSHLRRRLRGDFNAGQAGVESIDPTAAPISVEYMAPIYDPEGEYYRNWRAASAGFGRVNKKKPVLFVIFPWPVYKGMDRGEPYPYYRFHEQVRTALESEGIRSVDVTPALAELGDIKQFWAAPGDFHLNAEAHRIIAGLLQPEIEKMLNREGAFTDGND